MDSLKQKALSWPTENEVDIRSFGRMDKVIYRGCKRLKSVTYSGDASGYLYGWSAAPGHHTKLTAVFEAHDLGQQK